MLQTTIPGTQLRVSRFIFGTASLFNVGGAASRQRLIDAAIDSGFTHFDTAPYYGFGIAERDLASALRRHTSITVTTKVGLYSPGGENQGAAAVFLRKAAGRALKALSRPEVDWSIARARQSLDGSLRRLGREHVDFYALHEPELALLGLDEWQRWLEREVSDGRVRHFGVAPRAGLLKAFIDARGTLAGLIQAQDSLEGKEAEPIVAAGRPLQITYGYMSGARGRGAPADIRTVMGEALKRNPSGAIIVSTRRAERLPVYAALAGEAR